jgi:hypothetical protein
MIKMPMRHMPAHSGDSQLGRFQLTAGQNTIILDAHFRLQAAALNQPAANPPKARKIA